MWVVSFTPGPLYPRGKSPRYPLEMRLGGPQSRFGRCGEKCLVSDSSTVHTVARRCTDWGIATPFDCSWYSLQTGWVKGWNGGYGKGREGMEGRQRDASDLQTFRGHVPAGRMSVFACASGVSWNSWWLEFYRNSMPHLSFTSSLSSLIRTVSKNGPPKVWY
jgi:hypothetical protein